MAESRSFNSSASWKVTVTRIATTCLPKHALLRHGVIRLAQPTVLARFTNTRMKFELEPHHRDIPDEDLIADLSRVAAEMLKKRVTIDQYNERGKYHATTLTRRFGSWFTALELAGLQRTRNLNISNEVLFENLAELWLKLGRQPRYADIEGARSRFSAGTYEKRFGAWRKALEAFVSWANDGIELPDVPQKVAAPRRTSREPNWRLRALVLLRDGATCRMCGARPEHGVRLHVDHIKPWIKGGETVIENLQVLCERCNIGKSDVDPDVTS